jgi:2-C-methyl-D-erythritol 2,4-cyclodiphosphate synthase
LGGEEIAFEKGLLGHSDADVLCHAFADALLGAAALGDIGQHFPDTDGRWKDVSSLELLARIKGLLDRQGYAIMNLDGTILCQAPKLAGYIPDMCQNIANALGVDVKCVSVKATTEEGLGFTGTGAGIAAQAIALIAKIGISET